MQAGPRLPAKGSARVQAPGPVPDRQTGGGTTPAGPPLEQAADEEAGLTPVAPRRHGPQRAHSSQQWGRGRAWSLHSVRVREGPPDLCRAGVGIQTGLRSRTHPLSDASVGFLTLKHSWVHPVGGYKPDSTGAWGLARGPVCREGSPRRGHGPKGLGTRS